MRTAILLLTMFFLMITLNTSCVEECTFRDWQGTYVGTVFCDDFIADGVVLEAFLDLDGATVVYIGDYFSTAFYDDGCDVEFFQRSSVGRGDFEEEYYLELRGNEIYWEYDRNDDGFRTSCEGLFLML